MTDKLQSDQRNLDEPITVTLRRREWMVVVGAAESYDRRVPVEQGDGGACLDTIRAALDDVDSWCERCGRKHTMRGQVESCAGCGGERFVFRPPASDESQLDRKDA